MKGVHKPLPSAPLTEELFNSILPYKPCSLNPTNLKPSNKKKTPRPAFCATAMEYPEALRLDPQSHNKDGLSIPNSIIIVYMDPLGYTCCKALGAKCRGMRPLTSGAGHELRLGVCSGFLDGGFQDVYYRGLNN